METSAIVPFYAAETSIKAYLPLCLSSLLSEGDVLAEIILVVNGPNCQEHPEPPFESIRVIRTPDSLGYGAAMNLGASRAKTDLLLFCDADVYFPAPGWLTPHLQIRQLHPSVGISATKLVNYRTARILDFGIGRSRYNHFHPGRGLHLKHRSVQASRRVQMACSAVMMIERSLFEQVGRFDEVLKHHYQDVDLCLKSKREGKQVWVLADSLAIHRGASTGYCRNPFKIDERAYYAAKNVGLMQVDFASYLRPNLNYHREQLSSASPFALVDLSTMTDPSEATDVINEFADVTLLYKAVPVERDIDILTLADVLDAKVIRHQQPLIFLVDKAESLEFNVLWRAARETSEDLIVDRHSNVCRFDDICNNLPG